MIELRYLEDVVSLALNVDDCVGCGACTMVCPHGVLAMDGRKVSVVDLNGCMECAAYIIQVWIKGKENASCGGSGGCC